MLDDFVYSFVEKYLREAFDDPHLSPIRRARFRLDAPNYPHCYIFTEPFAMSSLPTSSCRTYYSGLGEDDSFRSTPVSTLRLRTGIVVLTICIGALGVSMGAPKMSSLWVASANQAVRPPISANTGPRRVSVLQRPSTRLAATNSDSLVQSSEIMQQQVVGAADAFRQISVDRLLTFQDTYVYPYVGDRGLFGSFPLCSSLLHLLMCLVPTHVSRYICAALRWGSWSICVFSAPFLPHSVAHVLSYPTDACVKVSYLSPFGSNRSLLLNQCRPRGQTLY